MTTAKVSSDNQVKDKVLSLDRGTPCLQTYSEEKNSVDFIRFQQDILLCQLRIMGFTLGGSNEQIKEIILPRYLMWFDEAVRILNTAGYSDNRTVSPLGILWQQWADNKNRWAKTDLSNQVQLVESTLKALPAILTGSASIKDILFLNKSNGNVAEISENSLQSDYFNQIIAQTIVAKLESVKLNQPHLPLRIFEIGAGTGETSKIVLEALRPYHDRIETYVYTDTSKTYLAYGEERYKRESPFLTTTLFDVEKPLSSQNILSGTYDIVIAANILYATKNIKNTLCNAKALLKCNGTLLINELVENRLFNHLTFGLTEEWWLPEDTHLRIVGCPILSVQNWKTLLCKQGFNNISWPAEKTKSMERQIIVAHSDGVVRQPVLTNTTHPTDYLNPLIQKESSTEKVSATVGFNKSNSTRTKILPAVEITDLEIEAKVTDTIVEQLSNALNVPSNEIGFDDSFMNIGVDSATSVKMVETVAATLGVELEIISVFSYTTVTTLADYIIKNFHSDLVAELNRGRLAHSDELSSYHENLLNRKRVPNVVSEGDVSGSSESSLNKITPQTFQNTNSLKHKSGVSHTDKIAVIGMSGRFGRSDDVSELWDTLAKGEDIIEEVSRWDLGTYDKRFSDGTEGFCRYGSALNDIDTFDPLFFNISGLEATYMDPQQRVFMEETWKALEDAGLVVVEQVTTRWGIYVGCSAVDYEQLIQNAGLEPPAQAFWGNAGSVLAARIAYYLDLKGPAISIDTACSSSLVAMHLACQSLWMGENSLAIAGGVFITTTPAFYLSAGRAGMLSAKGHCHAFDSRADGFVPGEGVGVVVLKRLADALADRDHIHGVIRGSGINQDGASNGITAPSAKSQELLEREVYDNFHIDPAEIQYVEAHGTGTVLGDPIEYQALTRAFRKDTDKKAYCAIGSIKSNLGHTATAAGVAGVIKVLLSLRHKQIPASLHYETGNPAINFEESPFYVNTHLKAWEVAPNKRRMAAISSFGFSGTNAHMVIEEAPPIERELTAKVSYLIVLSARSDAQLKQQSQQLVSHLSQNKSEVLGDISFTLLCGRKHFEHRLATVVRSCEELVERLERWSDGKPSSEIYTQTVKSGKRREQASLKRYGNECIASCESSGVAVEILESLSTVAELYTQGYQLDYKQLFKSGDSHKISLPTYPFSKERYWIESSEEEASPSKSSQGSSQANYLHPLLQENTSTAFDVQFTSRFSGDEFFFKDHQVQGAKILPGVGHLEMARAALTQALNADSVVELNRVVWLRPAALTGDSLALHISVLAATDSEIEYDIYSLDEAGEEILYSQGQGRLLESVDEVVLDLKGLSALCVDSPLSVEQLYSAFDGIGIHYGAGHQAIEALYTGLDGDNRPQVLAKLSVPSSLQSTQSDYVLHPGLMDSALQASIGLAFAHLGSSGQSTKPMLPFALESLIVYGPTPSNAYAWVRYSEGSVAEDAVQKLDISLCDEQGRVCVEFKGFSSRVLERANAIGTLILKPVWKNNGIDAELLAADSSSATYHEQHIFLCGLAQSSEALEQQAYFSGSDTKTAFFDLDITQINIGRSFKEISLALFEAMQKILWSKPKEAVLIQVLVPTYGQGQVLNALSGLLKTAQLENSKIVGQVIAVSKDESVDSLLEKLQVNRRYPQDQEIRYVGGERQVASFEEVLRDKAADSDQESMPEMPWREEGVYLITGGLGGLGLIFAEEILEKTPSARLILTGRSALKEEKALRLQGLESRGLKVEYHAVDVSDKEAVEILVQGIEKRWGGLHGIIHSAGIIKDKYLIKKNAIEFAEVMSPKVAGVINLDRASQTLGLDFFVVFSSGAGVMGNLGQGDYATANAFLDAFSVYRKDLEGAKERNGLSLSINWPLWKEGGMVVDEASARFMKDSLGLVPMETRRGLEAFYRGLDSCEPQVWVMEGEVKRLKRTLLARTKKSTESAIAASTLLPINSEPGFEVDLGTLLQKVQHMLKGMVASLLKLKIEDLDLDDDLSDYGFDSISLTEFANQMNQKYSLELTPTVFFENPTLEGFSEYLIEEYQEVFAKQFDVQTPTPTPTPTQTQTQTPTPTPIHAKPKTKEPKLEIVKTRHRSRSVKPIERPVTEAKSMGTMATDRIAIVGMSGRFPMARDINEFWENLQEGKDCIEEIPKDRWDWEEYFGDPTKEANKTNIKWGGFIEGVGDFDPVFFKINPSDAVLMDPQQRLMMSFIWLALEDAGYSASSLSGSNTGIFVGTTDTGYSSLIANSKKEIEASSAAAVVPSLGPNRMSYFLNFHGPSEPIETACSSSLVAMHRAITAMRVGDCEQSIVGGVNTLLSPAGYVAFGKMGVLSEDGRCKTFSAQANGYVRGEGVGMLVLKPLSIAEQNGDHIYGVILGSSQNHGGRANSLTAPNPKAQAELLVKAYQRAEVDPRTVSYIEAHGTGTALGDTIEIDALKTAFKKLNEIFREDGKDSKGSPVDIPHCALGSVKSNIGHLELSGGVAGLIKVLLQFKHKKIVQSLHCDEINPYIELKGSPFYTVNKAQKWNALKDSKGRLIPRRAGVSAFGFGGVNAHIILEEYIDKRNTSNVEIGTPHLVLIPLSAKNPRCLKVYAQKMLDFITRDVEQDGDIDLADLAYTLQVGREPMDARLGLIVDSKQMMIEKLRGYIEGHSYVADLYQGEVAKNKDTISVFASDEDLDDVVGVWIAKRKYDKLLGLWVKGLKFDWQQICQDDSKPRRISLPTYPFEQNRYWIGGDAHYEAAGKPLDPTSSLENVNVIENTVQRRRWEFSLPNNNDDSNHYYTLSIEEKANLLLQQLIADQLQLTVGELDVSKAFSELAMTSIGMVKVAQGIRSKVSLNFQPASMYEKTNISDLSNYLCQDYSEELDALKVRKAKCGDIAKRSLPNSKLNFPELIKLNEIDDGRPVFWFHAGLGGVATYHSVAMESQRPFYGVQAKGYQTDELPLLGIEAMSAYYVEIIKSVQSEGPYDLGGYSMGGAISYEVARQLQELGQVVSTITMLDTPDFSSLNLLNKVDQPGLDRTGLLRSFNGVLMQGLMTDPMAGMSLIHRDELNTELDYESFLKQMIMLAISKGCNTSEEELTKRVTQVNAVEAGYRLPLDSSRPLLNPGEVICYYFKNKSGQFLGEMAPYLSIDNKEEAMDGRNYWKGWENSVTNFQLMDVDSSSHMMLLTENTAKDTIIDFCKNLYRDVAVTA